MDRFPKPSTFFYNKKRLWIQSKLTGTILIVGFPFNWKDSYVQRSVSPGENVLYFHACRSSPCLQIGGYANSQVPPFTGRPYPGLFAKCKLALAVVLVLFCLFLVLSPCQKGCGHFNALKIPKEGVQLEVLFTRVSTQIATCLTQWRIF